MKRTPIRAVSPKRARDMKLRREVIRQVHERDQSCVFWLHAWEGPFHGEPKVTGAPVHCGGPLDVHELKNRSQGGDWLNPDECVLLCRFHHTWVTDNPSSAHSIGLHKWGWE